MISSSSGNCADRTSGPDLHRSLLDYLRLAVVWGAPEACQACVILLAFLRIMLPNIVSVVSGQTSLYITQPQMHRQRMLGVKLQCRRI